MVVQRMLRILEKDGYRFLVGVVGASADGSRPMLLVVEKDNQWRGFQLDVDGYKPSNAKFLLRLMLGPCPSTVSEIMSSIEEFADKYRGMVVWITNAI
jgi:hypothetical protein